MRAVVATEVCEIEMNSLGNLRLFAPTLDDSIDSQALIIGRSQELIGTQSRVQRSPFGIVEEISQWDHPRDDNGAVRDVDESKILSKFRKQLFAKR